MSARHSHSLLLAASLALLPAAAFAQPSNDTCFGAEVLTFNASGLATSTIVRNIATATALDAGDTAMSCAAAAKHSVWFTFTVPTTGTYAFETCGSVSYFSAIALYTGVCGTLAPVTGGCVTSSTTGNCSPGARFSTQTLDGGLGAPLNLTQGVTYYMQVGTTSATTAVTENSQVSLRVGLETAAPNDLCSGTLPALTLNRPLLVTTKAANTLLAGNDAELPNDAGCFQTGGAANTVTSASGQDVAVRFTAPTSGDFSFRVNQATVTTPNTVLYLADTCLGGSPAIYNAGACIAAVNRGQTGAPGTEELSCVPLSAGTDYTLWVDSVASSTGAAYTAVATACFKEEEQNNEPARANPLQCPMTGNFAPAGDVDFFEVGNHPGARLFAMIEMNATTSADSNMRVTTATDTLQYDDDDGTTDMGSLGSVVAGVTLPSGPTYVRVNYNTTTTQAGPYRLHSMLKFGAPVPEQEPNDTRAQANSLGLYVSGALATTTEVDIFSFDARVGDLVFVALDGAPARSGVASGNHNFEIFDALGWSIGLANDTNTANSNTAGAGSLTAITPTAPAEGYAFRASTNGTHYVHVTRSGTGAGADYLLAVSIDCGMVQPTLSSISATSGTVLGGETVTLLGSGFDETSAVFFGGTRATVTSRTSNSLTVTTPGANEGTVEVRVTNFGNLSSTLPNAFTYVAPIAPPSIASVTPAFGPVAGGTLITLTGSLFKTNAEVTFTNGATTAPATQVSVINATQLTCVTPSMPAGPADITVRNPVDDLSGSLANAYTFVPAPTLSAVTPSTGVTLGGLTLTVTGTGFLPGATVRFGTTLGTAVVVAADGLSLTVTSPAVTTGGPVAITVRNADGQQVVLAAAFTYVYPVPTIATVSPTTGSASGGQVITINGTGFLSAPPPMVTFDGVAAPSVSRLSATQLTLLTPPGAPGLADLVVTNNDGQSVSRAQAFTYVASPSILSVTPSRGPVQGGTRLTISGQNFVAGARVTVGGVPAFAPTVVDPNTISVVTNSGEVGLAAVVVENPDLQSFTLAGAFTYDAAPSLAQISPGTGSIAGGTVVTLTGAGFRAGVGVQFGTLPASAVTVVSETTVTAVTPASPLGVVTVRVQNDDGQAAALPRSFRFVAPPTLTAVAPATGDVAGATVVRVTGTNFGPMTTVTFGGVAAQRVSFVGATTLEAVTPPHAPGEVEVAVTNSNGDTATLSAGFRYTRTAPTLESLAPASGLTTGGVQVNVTGTGFAPNTTVTFGGDPATAVVMASPELLRVIAPAHAAGAVSLVVTNDDGQSATLTNGFLYVAPAVGEGNVVTDGGDGALVVETVDAGPGGGGGGGGCGCSSVDPTILIALGALLLGRRKRS
ncbi:MAG: IPT/TIG domain-containing protein [Archangium sp.]|nr:IPT/TIG domain-containing protein [Archangium sp.]MDP3157212.1 IPT/TIG domain-containing protein [Archangium sp.]MDP3576276.1 IPT/TIG domain-containing protein [Archangium sp.]